MYTKWLVCNMMQATGAKLLLMVNQSLKVFASVLFKSDTVFNAYFW
jgi:hypothetical protein